MEHKQRLFLPFLAAFVGIGFLSLMDALMKGASLATGVYTASLLRSLLAAAMLAPIWLATGFAWPKRAVLKLHIERGIVSAVMALTFFYALTKLPIAEAIAISFIAPLIALYFARIFLGETISRQAIVASLIGFAGTIVIVSGRLGRSDFDEGVALGLASLSFSALLYAYNFVVIRRQSQVAKPLECATFHSGVGGLVQALAAPFFFVLPGTETLGMIGFAAALTAVASMLISWSYARAEAQVLVPVEYTSFLWAALLGWLYFQEEVTLPTMLGVSLIVVGCWLAIPRKKKPARVPSD
ncbi:DMT family transporter [Aurantiacibacter sp. MUD61]|uniref:DMT family transporter n=1 Tax=Aurantiacibacter sp. MUD61 TaxID=3009083 RepID=UPI0022F02F94|nr:DMT family transporter [Aurantiacibacter sp. MUD61]